MAIGGSPLFLFLTNQVMLVAYVYIYIYITSHKSRSSSTRTARIPPVVPWRELLSTTSLSPPASKVNYDLMGSNCTHMQSDPSMYAPFKEYLVVRVPD